MGNSSIKLGTETTCYCGRKIAWLGRYWDHVNDPKPRHMARPQSPELFSSKNKESEEQNGYISI